MDLSKSDYRKGKKSRIMLSCNKHKKRKGNCNIVKWNKKMKLDKQDGVGASSVRTNSNISRSISSPDSGSSAQNNDITLCEHDTTTSIMLCEPSTSGANNSSSPDSGSSAQNNDITLCEHDTTTSIMLCEPSTSGTNNSRDNSNKKEYHIEGRRIVDLLYFFKQIQKLNDHGRIFDCSISNMHVVKEIRNGFKSVLTLKCNMCNYEGNLYTNDSEAMDLNTSAVNGIIAVGSGYTHLEEISASMEIPCMTPSTFQKIQNSVCDAFEKNAALKMQEAAEEEKALAIEQGNVGSDGVPEITVVCDGTWAKRSYRTNYSALSGAAAIIGRNTKKVLYLGVKNKYCMICERAKHKNVEPSTHTCFKNWTGTSTAMEAAILSEGFNRSEEMYGLRYTKFIADGDSSCYHKILECRPYNKTVEKIECRNHLLRNFCTKIKDLTTKSAYGPVALRRKLESKILKMRVAVVRAIKHRKESEDVIHVKSINLKEDILNVASHVFGEHRQCKDYFCTKKTPDEDNLVPSLTKEGLYPKILDHLRYLSNHSRSLIYDVDSNIVEQFNSIICKLVGGKRLNYCSRRQYQSRCAAAVITHNSRKSVYYNMHKFISGTSPTSNTVKRMERRRNCLLKHRKNKKLIRRLHFDKTEAMDYGPNCVKPDLTEDDFKAAKNLFLKSLHRTDAERKELENRTKQQVNSIEWVDERRKLLTASNFGIVCNRRESTNCGVLVKYLLYSDEIHSAAMEWGKLHEGTAREELAQMQNMIIEDSGLHIDKDFPYLGATPDGLVGDRGIVEIKCPYSARNMTPEDGIKMKKILIWKMQNGDINKKHKWYYQVQGQLQITDRDYCILAVWTLKGIKSETILRDKYFWKNSMFPNLQRFYLNCILPEIVDPRIPRNMKVREPQYILEAQRKKK